MQTLPGRCPSSNRTMVSGSRFGHRRKAAVRPRAERFCPDRCEPCSNVRYICEQFRCRCTFGWMGRSWWASSCPHSWHWMKKWCADYHNASWPRPANRLQTARNLHCQCWCGISSSGKVPQVICSGPGSSKFASQVRTIQTASAKHTTKKFPAPNKSLKWKRSSNFTTNRNQNLNFQVMSTLLLNQNVHKLPLKSAAQIGMKSSKK